jgi:AraC-like DNA-binding protein
MQYREIKPGPSVGRFVKCYWILEDHCPAPVVQTIVPDGRSELIINLAHPFQHEIEGQWHAQPDIFFVGQITGPFLVRPQGPSTTIGVRFRPEGAGHLFGVPMSELTDAVMPLSDISRTLHDLLDHLQELPSLAQHIVAIEEVLGALADRRVEDQLISAAVKTLEQANGSIGIRHLSDSFGLSSRQFERRFRTAVGIPPKLFCRMQRFQQVFQTINRADANWVDVAVICGYYDQAHLIRDFREFSGTTPTALTAAEFDLTRHFCED